MNDNNDLLVMIEKSKYLHNAISAEDTDRIVSVGDVIDCINRAAYRRRLEGGRYSETACSSMPRH